MNNKEFNEENVNATPEEPKQADTAAEITEETEELAPEAPEAKAEVLREPPGIFTMKKTWIMLLSFLMPFLICIVVYLVGGYYPIGDKQIIVTDFWHQYFPMIRELRETLLEGGSLLWNWHSGLGTNFLSMIGYYCASPLNLLTVFMPESFLPLGVSLIVFIKIGLCGLFCSIFLMKAFERKDISVVFFSCLYATCACIMGYYWNLMWLDSIALFPLVILGVILLIRDKKPLLYTITLALSLIFNYYIGVYVCIAVLLFSVCTVIITWKSLKEAVLSFFRMLIHSCIGIGITAILLLPSYLALQNSYYAANSTVGDRLWNGPLTQFLATLFPFQYPNSVDLNTPNLCCGMICLFLFVIFLCGKAKVREKICACALLVFLFFSFMYRPLDFLWNGAHYVNQIPFRYSFIFSFVLIACAYRAFCLLEKINILHILAAFEVTAAGACLLYAYLPLTAILLSVGSAVIYAVLLLLYERNKVGPRLCGILLCSAIAIECATAGAFGISKYSVYSTYLAESDSINALFDSIDDTGFYRTEITNTKTLNDPLLFGYNGVSQFSSGANSRVSTFMKAVGVGGSPTSNRYVYYQSTPFINSVLSIKYLISKAGSNTGDTTLTYKGKHERFILYKNQYYLPIAFTVKEDISIEDMNDYSPFRNQNALFRAMTGISAPLFNEAIHVTADADGGNVNGSYGNFKFKPTTEAVTLTFTFNCRDEGLYYFYPKIEDATSLAVKWSISNTTNFNYKNVQAAILPAGYHQPEDIFYVGCKITDDGEEHSANLRYAVMDEEVLLKGYEILSQNTLTDVTYTDTSVSGNITVEEDSLLYTSIPYEKGWRAYVDGEPVEIAPYADTFLSLDLDAGEHTVVFKYTPDGLIPGIVITLSGILACVLSAIFYNRRKATAETTTSAEPAEETAE